MPRGKSIPAEREPKTLIRIGGQAPLKATVFEMERLRCNACCQVFTAEEPAGVGAGKYDMTAMAMIALLKYGTGMPFNRMERSGWKNNWGCPWRRQHNGSWEAAAKPVYFNADAFCQELGNVFVGEWVSQVPKHAQNGHLAGETGGWRRSRNSRVLAARPPTSGCLLNSTLSKSSAPHADQRWAQ